MLRKAQVIQGTESLTEEGVTGACRCVLLLEDHTKRVAILKRGSTAEVTSELFCALLLRAWGLPIPEPFIVDDDGKAAFASGDAGYPDLKTRLGIKGLDPSSAAHGAAVAKAIQIAASLPSAALALAADEAIGNVDRNLGNILWDGAQEAWIDHAFCLGLSSLPDANKLAVMALHAGRGEAMRSSAVGQALALSMQALQTIAASQSDGAIDMNHGVDYVRGRAVGLAGRILSRFPVPNDLLSPQ